MATSAVKLLSPRIVAQTGKQCTASVIMLHGSGGTGADIRDTFKLLLQEDLSFPHIRVIYPTAPVRPYTLAGGQRWNVWFDRLSLGLDAVDHLETVDAMATQLGQLIDGEIKSGIPINRIVVGGFSMGGTMALHLGYRFYPDLAGVLAMSSFLHNSSSVYEALEKTGAAGSPPLQQYHGELDDLVLYSWGQATYNRLTALGVKGQFISIPNLSHSLNRTMAQSVREWITKVLPQ